MMDLVLFSTHVIMFISLDWFRFIHRIGRVWYLCFQFQKEFIDHALTQSSAYSTHIIDRFKALSSSIHS